MNQHPQGACAIPRPSRGTRSWLLAAWLAFCATGIAQAIQFDAFLGYDGIVPESSWFPIVCEVKNDGPPFNGIIEVTTGAQDQPRRLLVELPTGTLKRLVIPVFSATRGFSSSWDVRLVDERGRKRAEPLSVRASRTVASGVPLVGSLPRTANGKPMFRTVVRSDEQPASARLLPQIFPDNPLVLEGMDCLYLNSERAMELSEAQVTALYGWLNAGGHLIIAVEQVAEINAKPWLKSLFPCDLKEMRQLQGHPELQAWLRSATWATGGLSRPRVATRSGASINSRLSLSANPFNDLMDDLTFETAGIEVATGEVRQGNVVVSVGDAPLIVTANHERGQVTALLFSPEREPFRSWKNLPVFWAKLVGVPAESYVQDQSYYGQVKMGSDGIFGAMIDTRQVHKLPVEWLLFLLLVYLVVIGPLDQYWLKRIGKPMLTWITFPSYVVLFSLVIYLIGYKLRAGDSEWTELHVVDVYPNGESAELRGRTYASVYSPLNQRYPLEAQEKFAILRGETAKYGGTESNEKLTVTQAGDSCAAEILVPVWTSQLLVGDWWQPAPVPLKVTMVPQANGWRVTVENKTDHRLAYSQIVVGGNVANLGEIPANQAQSFQVGKSEGMQLNQFVSNYGRQFVTAAQSRSQAFGRTELSHIDDKTNGIVAASFLSQFNRQQGYQGQGYQMFSSPPGLDLSPAIDHGQAVVFAWAENYSPVRDLNQFTPRRIHRDTMFRVSVQVP